MPFFSIIIPVYNVEGQLRRCIDSVYNQTFSSFEVLAVEDKSTDNSKRLLLSLSKKYNFKPILLDNNSGLANARNIGLESAKGKYVLFLDSDDEYEPELLGRLYENAKQDNIDLIVFDYYREWEFGYKLRNNKSYILDELDGKIIDNNDCDNRKKILSLLNISVTKAYRLSLINQHKLKFPDGYYEDITFHFESILLANKISICNYAGYKYRQRLGSILNSKSDSHSDLIIQYERLYSFLKLNYNDDILTYVDEKFIDHVFSLTYKNKIRVTKKARYLIISGVKKIINNNKIRTRYHKQSIEKQMSILTKSNVFSVLFFDSVFFIKKKLNIKSLNPKNIKSMIAIKLKFLIYKWFFKYLPIRKDVAVFESYWGSQYSCNPRALSEYLSKNSNIKPIWFLNRKIINGLNLDKGSVQFIPKLSLRYFYYIATAKYFINNVNFPDFLKKREGTIHIQTQHGTPLKLMGFDERLHAGAPKRHFIGLRNRSARWDYLLSSNSYSSEVWKRCFPFNYKVIELGYPRNDILVNYKDNIKFINEVKNMVLPLRTLDKTVILFMPTWRGIAYNDGILEISRNISEEYIILYRKHHLSKVETTNLDNVIDVSNFDDVNKLYLISDVLITDYSSAMFDYSNLNRPIVLYTPDYIEYIEKRGVYFDIQNKPPGHIFNNIEDLIFCFNGHHFNDEESERSRELFMEEFCEFDNGNASKRIVDGLFKGELM